MSDPRDRPHQDLAIRDIHAALTVLCNGIIFRTTYTAHEWDHAVTTLACAHQQLGGHLRHLVYAAFAATHPHTPPSHLPVALLALAEALDLAIPEPSSQPVEPEQLALPFTETQATNGHREPRGQSGT